MQVQIDNWCIGIRGHLDLKPVSEALVADGRVEQRLIFSNESANKEGFLATGLPCLTTLALSSVSAAPRTLARMRKSRADMHAWYAGRGALVHVLKGSPWDAFYLDIPKKHGATILFTIHDARRHLGEENWLFDAFERRHLAMADHIAVLSNYSAKVLRERFRLKQPIHVMSNDVFMGVQRPMAAKAAPAGRPLKLLFLGRIHRYKGLNLLIDALDILRREDAPPVELTIAGAGDVEPYREALARNPGIRLMQGWMSDETMERVLAEHDVNVVPYLETYVSGITLNGMWAGMPTIATPLAAFDEQLQDGENALIAANISAEAIASCIRRLAGSPELFSRLAQGAHSKAVSLGAPWAASRWHDLYREILAARRL